MWCVCIEENSNDLAFGDQHLEIARGLALSQGVEHMRSEEL